MKFKIEIEKIINNPTNTPLSFTWNDIKIKINPTNNKNENIEK